MKLKKPKLNFSNVLSVIIIIVLIIPQTRKPIQIAVNKVMALISPHVETRSERRKISDFNYKLESLDAKPYNLTQSEYKVTIVSFWATWCPPCIAELPSLNNLYKDYKDKVEFVFISNEKPSVLKNFLKENEYNFPVYIPVGEAQDIYFKPRTIPRTLLIDRNSRVVIIQESARNWNSDKIRGILDKLVVGDIVY
jgi:thiol-disulfide isomerase/thioredoxin